MKSSNKVTPVLDDRSCPPDAIPGMGDQVSLIEAKYWINQPFPPGVKPWEGSKTVTAMQKCDVIIMARGLGWSPGRRNPENPNNMIIFTQKQEGKSRSNSSLNMTNFEEIRKITASKIYFILKHAYRRYFNVIRALLTLRLTNFYPSHLDKNYQNNLFLR